MASAQEDLREAVERLALPGKQAIRRVAAPGRTADRMALRFDESYTAWVGSLSDLPGEVVLETLQRIDGALLELARPEHRALWTDAELCASEAWETLRSLAREAVSQLEAAE